LRLVAELYLRLTEGRRVGQRTATPVTVIVDDPVGVEAESSQSLWTNMSGLHDAVKEAVAPVGRPEAEKDTDCAVPETSVAVIVWRPIVPGQQSDFRH